MLIDRQFSSSHCDWPQLRDAVLAAEAQGVGRAWVLDHLDGRVLGGDRDMLECFTLLGALAAETSTIGLGTLVMNVANRHPAIAALAASSVQRISGGRLMLGIGAGANPATPWAAEHHDRGIPLLPAMADRHAAVVRQIEVLRAVEPMRLVVGVNSVALARIAGVHADGVNVRLGDPRAGEYLDAARDAAGDRAFDVSAWARDDDPSAVERAQLLGLDRLILLRLDVSA